MTEDTTLPPTPAIAFGPVPSRRLGRSLGVNNVLPRTCSYACAYCQLGRTRHMRLRRRAFHGTDAVVDAVRAKVAACRELGEPVDYVTFVADGEPTLDADLGREIGALRAALRPLGIPIAVITNASLLGRAGVRADLMAADWVSVKVDAVDAAVWRRVDRPHGRLRLAEVLVGVATFAQAYAGELVTETMLLRGSNDEEAHLERLAETIARFRPARAYLAIPTRPPTEPWVSIPDGERLTRAYGTYAEQIDDVELLIGYEGDAFAASGDARVDILSITAVHPMQQPAMEALVARDGAEWSVVESLIAEGLLLCTEYAGRRFYARQVGARAVASG